MASLLALRRAEAAVGKTYIRMSFWAHVVTLVVGIPALFATGAVAYLLAVLALLSEVTAWVLRYYGYGRHALAEEAGRRALLDASLVGSQSESVEIAELVAKVSKRAKRIAPRYEDPNYYASTKAPGVERLQETMEESAFFSLNLYRKAATAALVAAGVLGSLILLAFILLVVFNRSDVLLLTARVVVLFLSFLIATDYLGQGMSWLGAANEIDRLLARLSRIDPHQLDALLGVFGDYSAAIATRPPIPERIYEKNKADLAEAWAARRRSSSSES